jgi:hypothetical protein
MKSTTSEWGFYLNKDLIDFADENFITIKFIPDTKEVLQEFKNWLLRFLSGFIPCINGARWTSG